MQHPDRHECRDRHGVLWAEPKANKRLCELDGSRNDQLCCDVAPPPNPDPSDKGRKKFAAAQPQPWLPKRSARVCTTAAPALSLRPFSPYIRGAGLPAMAINGRRNKPFGPGGSTRRLHQIRGSLAGDRIIGRRSPLRGRNRIDEGVKGVLLLGMVPPLSGHCNSCQRQLCSGCAGRLSGLQCRSKALMS